MRRLVVATFLSGVVATLASRDNVFAIHTLRHLAGPTLFLLRVMYSLAVSFTNECCC